jgi:hypothetical protein
MPQLACRALSVKGKVSLVGVPHPLTTGAALDGLAWLEVEKDAELSVRHVTSARELRIVGPALVLPCSDGEEQVLVVRGRVVTSAGPGARPGAQVLIASPFGEIRYGNAQLDVRVSAVKAEAKAESGEAWVEPAKGAHRTGPEHLEKAKQKATLSGKTDAQTLVDECREAASDAARRARAVLAPAAPADAASDGGALGERARAHVEARQRARGACAVARAAVRRSESTKDRDRQEMLIRRAESLWRAVPRREPAPPR